MPDPTVPAAGPAAQPAACAPAIAAGGDLPFSAAAERNKAPILEQLAARLPACARVLEIASGTGQHAAHFAAAQPGWHWQPSDIHPASATVLARRCTGLANVAPLLKLDLLAWPDPWPATLAEPFDAVYAANVLHIAPWACCAGLMTLAARVLRPGGLLMVYGPFIQAGVPTAPSNLAFDETLRQQDPAWGLRHLEDIRAAAHQAGLTDGSPAVTNMPANNLLLSFRSSLARV